MAEGTAFLLYQALAGNNKLAVPGKLPSRSSKLSGCDTRKHPRLELSTPNTASFGTTTTAQTFNLKQLELETNPQGSTSLRLSSLFFAGGSC
jgi:hypothetical protein